MYVRHQQAIVDEVLARAAGGEPKLRIANDLGLGPGTVRRWIARGGVRQFKVPPCDGASCSVRDLVDHAAYAYLLGMYLGDGSLVAFKRSSRLEVWCDPKYPGIIREVIAAATTVLPNNRVNVRRRPHVSVVNCYSSHLPCLFPQHGPGRKHERRIVLEPWQRQIALIEHPDLFARGLIHSDGWRGINRVRGANGDEYHYPRYMFSNRSDDIRALFVDACKAINVEARPTGRWNVAVSNSDGVRRLDEVIGPKF